MPKLPQTQASVTSLTPNHPATPLTPLRYHGLDSLRALAIMLVFMHHYMIFVSGEATFGWASIVGWSGVDLFFVLSGYLISNPLFAALKRGQGFSLPNFFARRMLRTLPNFYFMLALFFLFPAFMGGKPPPELWRFLSFTQNLGLTPGTAFSHAWSLCIEEQFYLLLPLVIALGLRLRQHLSDPVRLAWWAIGLTIVCAITTRSLLWLDYGREALGQLDLYHSKIYYSTWCRFDELLPGVALALLQHAHPKLWQALLARGQALLLGGLVAVGVMWYLALNHHLIEGYGYAYFMTGFGYSLMAIAFAVLVLASLSPGSLLYRLRIPGASQLALWSYAIYLSHKPLAMIVHRYLKPYAVNPTLELLLITILSLVFGWLMYLLIETPFMKLRQRYFPVAGSRDSSVPQSANDCSAMVRRI